MAEKERYKMCPHCEGQVNIDFDVCPYCGGDTSYSQTSDNEYMPQTPYYFGSQNLSPEETISSLYPPPYQPKIDQAEEVEEVMEEKVMEEEAPAQEEAKNILPILFCSLGVLLFVLGLFMALFSENGELVLRWNAKLWYLYLLTSAPLFYLGFKKLL